MAGIIPGTTQREATLYIKRRDVWRHCIGRKDVFVWHYFYFSHWKLTTHYRRCQLKRNITARSKRKAAFQLMRHGVARKTTVSKCYSWLGALFNELALRPGRILIVSCWLFEPRTTVQQLVSWLTDDATSISVKMLTLLFVLDGTKQHTWQAEITSSYLQSWTELKNIIWVSDSSKGHLAKLSSQDVDNNL
jgi:hypothetical protein